MTLIACYGTAILGLYHIPVIGGSCIIRVIWGACNITVVGGACQTTLKWGACNIAVIGEFCTITVTGVACSIGLIEGACIIIVIGGACDTTVVGGTCHITVLSVVAQFWGILGKPTFLFAQELKKKLVIWKHIIWLCKTFPESYKINSVSKFIPYQTWKHSDDPNKMNCMGLLY